METFEIRLRKNDEYVDTFEDLRYSVTVVRNAATNEVYQTYFELLPSGKKFDGLVYKLFINGVEKEFLKS